MQEVVDENQTDWESPYPVKKVRTAESQDHLAKYYCKDSLTIQDRQAYRGGSATFVQMKYNT